MCTLLKTELSRAVLWALMAILVFTGCAQEQTGGVNSAKYTLKGSVEDADGAAVKGARVSADGVEADDLTDSNGRYTVSSPYPFDTEVIVTATKPGMEPLYAVMPNSGDAHTTINPVTMSVHSGPAVMDVVTPRDGEIISLNQDCDGEVTVQGIVSYPPRDNVRLDVMILLDASGSTQQLLDDNVSDVFTVEIQAAKELLSQLNNQATREGLVRFAATAEMRQELSRDFDAVGTALDAMDIEGPESLGSANSGTNFEAALTFSQHVFEDYPLEVIDSDTNGTINVQSLKMVILISDGIPTLPEEPGLTQEREDVKAAMRAATELRKDQIAIHTYAVGMEKKTRKLTSMPSLSAISKGRYYEVNNPEDIVLVLPHSSLVGMGLVQIENILTGEALTVAPYPDGFFEATIGVDPGLQTLAITGTDADEVMTITQEIVVEGQYYVNPNEPQGLGDEYVSISGLTTPYGNPLGDNDLQNLFFDQQAEFPDLMEAVGAEVFTVPGDPGEDVTVDLELILKEACYKSDFGYLVVDPARLEESTREAFASAKNDSVLFNSGDVAASCNATYFAPGTQSAVFSFTEKGGTAVVFFMVPNNTLKKAQQGKADVLFTIASLNPGGYDQVLNYYSALGRKGVGGPQSVYAWEDMTMVNSSSDKDFSDVVFCISKVVPSLPVITCE